MNKIIRGIFLFILINCLVICGLLITCSPVRAILREHHESPGVLRYHVHSSLQDNKGMTWQVILFPEYNSKQVVKYHLRLVGFPGITQFRHPHYLQLITADGKLLSAIDLITITPPAANVGEFDLTTILPILSENKSVELSMNLRDNQNLSLKIPESTVTEWQLLLTATQK